MWLLYSIPLIYASIPLLLWDSPAYCSHPADLDIGNFHNLIFKHYFNNHNTSVCPYNFKISLSICTITY